MITWLDLLMIYFIAGLPVPLFGIEILRNHLKITLSKNKIASIIYVFFLWIFWYVFFIKFLVKGAKE
jgi:hypothetical protein